MQDRSIATREKLLESAARVFDRHGFAAASISDILHEAGVTKGALYFHFQSKVDLADAIIRAQLAVLELPREQDQSPLQQLVDLSLAFAEALIANVLIRASIRLTLERRTFSDEGSGIYREWADVVRDILVRAEARGELRSLMKVDDVARFITASFSGVQLQSEALTNRADLLERLRDMWQIVLPSIVTVEAFRRLSI